MFHDNISKLGGHFLSQIISDVENLADFLPCPIHPLEERSDLCQNGTCTKKKIKFAIARVKLER